MPTFEIRYAAFRRDASLRAGFHWFDVRSGQTDERVAVGLTDRLRDQWALAQRPNAQEIELRTAVSHLKQHLATVRELARHWLLLTAGEPPKFGDEWSADQVPKDCPYERKECRHRLGKQGDYHCSAAEEGDGWGGRTTLANCEACGLPSTDIVCCNLVHASTRSSRSIGLPWSRQLWDVHCELGHGVDGSSAAECVPGERDCWVQTYEPEQPLVGTHPGERNLAAEVLDMADTLNTIFRNQFGAEFFRLKQFRTGRVLMEPCTSEEGFAFKLQVLGDLIDLMNSKELGEAQGVTSEPGSVNWLAAFLERVGQRDPAPVIQTLRDIRTLRKQLAAHSAATDHFVQACGRLGVDLPIRDWEGAWRRLLSAFLDTLRRLQGLLP